MPRLSGGDGHGPSLTVRRKKRDAAPALNGPAAFFSFGSRVPPIISMVTVTQPSLSNIWFLMRTDVRAARPSRGGSSYPRKTLSRSGVRRGKTPGWLQALTTVASETALARLRGRVFAPRRGASLGLGVGAMRSASAR